MLHLAIFFFFKIKILNFDRENDVSLKCVDVLENEDDG